MKYNTKIGEFCDTHDNWEELLTAEPYCLKIKKNGPFVIFNYNMLCSDLSLPIVQEARGIIFDADDWHSPVCHAFDKFFNYGEPNCANMHWDSVVVSEKIDGSIMKLWFDGFGWNVSTNANIFAIDAPCPDIRRHDYGELFWEGIDKHLSPAYIARSNWLSSLNKEFTYIFEMVSPYTRVVIPYEETDVYFLGARHNLTGQEFGCDADTAMMLCCGIFPRPKLYPMQTLIQVTAAANTLPWDAEGYVCYDKYFNRCKIKSPKYVMAHYARNNNVVTKWHIINVILKGERDEFLVYCSDYSNNLIEVEKQMDRFKDLMDNMGKMARTIRHLDKKEFAKIVTKLPKLVQPIMFFNYDRDVSAEEYMSKWDAYQWERALEQYDNYLGK